MKVTGHTQAPKSVQPQTAQKAAERPQAKQVAQPKPQAAQNPSHLGKHVDVKG